MVFEFEARCGDYGYIYGSIERTGKCGDDEAADEMLVSFYKVAINEERSDFTAFVYPHFFYCIW